VQYLRTVGVVAVPGQQAIATPDLVAGFCEWMRRQRGATDTTLRHLLCEDQEREKPCWGLYTFTFAARDELRLAFYFDDRLDLEWARRTWDSVEHHDTAR
jgi:hypothetical protein